MSNAMNVTNAMSGSRLSEDDTIAEFAVTFSAVAAATSLYPAKSLVTQVKQIKR